METLIERLKDEELASIVTTAKDYGMLLIILSQKTNKPVDELREGKGRLTYGEWNNLIN
jgi:hypothetical protein